MGYNSNTPKQSFTASASQTEFNFNYKIFDSSDVLVYQTLSGATPDDTADILTETTHYTVSNITDNGFTVTLVTGAAINDTIIGQRSIPIDRDTDYQQGGDMLSSTIDADQDKQTYLIADQAQTNSQAIRLPNTAVGISTQLPDVVPGSFLAWNATGDAIINNSDIGDTADNAQRAEDAADAAEASAASINLPTIQAGDAGKYLKVTIAEDGYEHTTLVAGGNVGTKTVNETAIADDKIIVYKSGADEFVYEDKPSGTILQILQAYKTDTFSSSSTSFIDVTGLSIAITPTATSSKILVSVNISVGTNDVFPSFKLLRDSTEVGSGNASGSINTGFAGNRVDGIASTNNFTMEFIDSPSSISELTYKIQARVNGLTWYLNRAYNEADSANYTRVASSITVTEIGA